MTDDVRHNVRSAETMDGELLTVFVTGLGVEIEVRDPMAGETLSNLKLDPYNAHRLGFLLDAAAARVL